MYQYPELLTAQDSSRDTPISVALKECANFVLSIGESNRGKKKIEVKVEMKWKIEISMKMNKELFLKKNGIVPISAPLHPINLPHTP